MLVCWQVKCDWGDTLTLCKYHNDKVELYRHELGPQPCTVYSNICLLRWTALRAELLDRSRPRVSVGHRECELGKGRRSSHDIACNNTQVKSNVDPVACLPKSIHSTPVLATWLTIRNAGQLGPCRMAIALLLSRCVPIYSVAG